MRSIALGIALLAAGAAAEERVEDPVQTEHTVTVDGIERAYLVQAPRAAKGKKLPVVFLFHGGGGRAQYMTRTAFRSLAGLGKLIAVCPQGWRNRWNDGRKGEAIPAQVRDIDDVKFVRIIVDDLAKRLPIDKTRLFSTGVSNGAIFSHRLAAEASDLFAAIAPIIGGLAEPLAPKFKPAHPISLLVIQGTADPLVPFNGGPIGAGRLGKRGSIIATAAMLKKYLAHNGIEGDPELEVFEDAAPDDGTTTIVRRYPQGKAGVRVELYVVKNGGHAVPGNPSRALRESLVGKTSRDFDAYAVIWAFFESCPPRRAR
jgi:polyhydroxybutyrate depolymerase